MVDAAANNRSQNKIASDSRNTLRIPVDKEHGGIRAAGCISLIVGAVVIYLLVESSLLDMPVLSVFISMAGSAAASALLERFLRGRWLSGRELVLSDGKIALLNQDDTERQINPQTHVNVLAWYFEVKRAARVKKGWYVVSLALEQDDEHIPVYTFMPPDDFEATDFSGYFTRLEREDKRKKKSNHKTTSGMRRAGHQRRLYEAEVDRGYVGAELTREEFTQLIQHLHEQFPQWMPDA